MTLPRFESRISLGHIIEIAAILVALVLAWGRLEANQSQLRDQLRDHFAEVEVLKGQYVRRDVHDQADRRIDEKLSAIEKKLELIERAVKRW